MFDFLRPRKKTSNEQIPKPHDRIESLAAKIAELSSRDAEMTTFGSSNYGSGHHYRMREVLSIKELVAFESAFDVQLPRDYAAFLLKIGNGGIGPYYGLYSLSQSLSEDDGDWIREFLTSPFPLTALFNPCEVDDPATQDDPYDRNLCGSIVLSHHGCGYYDRLVITGPQAGQVWSDFQAADQGIVPLHCDFYEWYDEWLNDSLRNL